MEKEGFVLDPYDKCTANKTITGKKFTIQWYVEKNKFMHVSADVITGVMDITKKYFGELVSETHDNYLMQMEEEVVK